jgi:hypothetical protein
MIVEVRYERYGQKVLLDVFYSYERLRWEAEIHSFGMNWPLSEGEDLAGLFDSGATLEMAIGGIIKQIDNKTVTARELRFY